MRSKLLALREEDFAHGRAADGRRSPARIIGRHLLPSFMSHLIASATLSIPCMILGETALSFLGLGLRPPITSWGVLLNEAQNINVVALYPWLMLPVVPVIIVDPRLQLHGRRPARRGRPVPIAGLQARAVLVRPRTESVRRFLGNRHRLADGSVESMPINDLPRFRAAVDWHA